MLSQHKFAVQILIFFSATRKMPRHWSTTFVLTGLLVMSLTVLHRQAHADVIMGSCTGSSTPMQVIYNNTAITAAAGDTARLSCSYTWTGTTGNSLAFRLCTTASTATSTGSGGATVNPRLAKSASGGTAQYQINAINSANAPLTAANISLGVNSQGTGVAPYGGGSVGTFVWSGNFFNFTMTATQNLAQADYQTTLSIPLVLEWNTAVVATQPADCTVATDGSTPVTLTLPITIRANSSCDIRPANMNFGQISINGGTSTTIASTSSPSVAVICAAGVTHSLSISDGNNASGTGAYRRRISNGTAYLSYGLFTSNAYTTEWTSVAGATAGTGGIQTAAYTLYGRIPPQASGGLTNGLYTDTAIMTLTY